MVNYGRSEVNFLAEKVKKSRIWELDSFRGLCILGMVAVHTVWDLDFMLTDFRPPLIYDIAITYGALLFIILSGVCVTLGSRSIKRGLIVLGCGLLVSLGFELGNRMGLGNLLPVYFGILHLLGACMLLYPIFKKLPFWLLFALGLGIILTGKLVIDGIHTDFAPLLVLGFDTDVSGMSDYFPLFPNLGWFLIGAGLGKLLYKEKKSLFPNFPQGNAVCRFLSFCGRHSLIIYVVHQPIIYGILYLII
ncbi:MAG: DUF1624 domain-containing protein [Clostridia bacterium]|nr:DUF1624 domain-containing protein [Clostridia bacterium]